MNVATLLTQPFFQVTLPIVLTIFIATWAQNRRIDDLSRRIDDLARRLDRVERIVEDILKTLVGIEHRLTVVEERTSPLTRR